MYRPISVSDSFGCSAVVVFQEVEMVCVACNGKGYVIERHHESVCSECQGRGECFLCDSDRHSKQDPQEIHEAR